MIALLAAFQFLTTVPPLVRRAFTPQELGQAAGWYPLVGVGLGAALYGVSFALSQLFPGDLVAIAVLVSWIMLTGALHFDGFLDTCDGLFGGRTANRRLEIMRDSRVGAFGVAGGVLLLLAKYVVLAQLLAPGRANPALFVAPAMGRWAMVLAMFAFPYAREQGLGRAIKDNLGWLQPALASAIAVAVALLFGIPALVALVSVLLLTLLSAVLFLQRLPGLTGDSYGAICETSEVVVLWVFAVSWSTVG